MASTPQSLRLSRLSQAQVESGESSIKIDCTFPAPKLKAKDKVKAGGKGKAKAEYGESDGEEDGDVDEKPPKKARAKARGQIGEPLLREGDLIGDGDIGPAKKKPRTSKAKAKPKVEVDASDIEEELTGLLEAQKASSKLGLAAQKSQKDKDAKRLADLLADEEEAFLESARGQTHDEGDDSRGRDPPSTDMSDDWPGERVGGWKIAQITKPVSGFNGNCNNCKLLVSYSIDGCCFKAMMLMVDKGRSRSKSITEISD